jgi:hypothetical protein
MYLDMPGRLPANRLHQNPRPETSMCHRKQRIHADREISARSIGSRPILLFTRLKLCVYPLMANQVICARDYPEHVVLPRGCLQELLDLLRELGVPVCVDDRRTNGKSLNLQFHGELNKLQMKAAEELLKQETGVLVAPTAFGKTVVAAWLIAQRKVSTLVLVHTRQLMDQWINRLETFLGLPAGEIGQIGAGRMNAQGNIDVGILQSFEPKNEASVLSKITVRLLSMSATTYLPPALSR